MVWQRQGAVIYHASREHAALEAYEAVITEGLQTFIGVDLAQPVAQSIDEDGIGLNPGSLF